MTPTHQPTTRGINGSTSTRHVQRRVREDRVHGSLLSRQRDRAHRDQLADRRAASRVLGSWISPSAASDEPNAETSGGRRLLDVFTCTGMAGRVHYFSDICMLGPARVRNRKLDMAF